MIDGQEVGPITRAKFALRLANSMVDAETYVWTQGMDDWLPAARVEDLAGIFKARQQARRSGLRPPPPPAAARAKGRSAPPVPPPAIVPPAPAQDPSEAKPPLDEQDDRTSIDMLPLGERVHQEEVASELFTSSSGEHSVSSSGNTGAIPVDTLPWAQQKPGGPKPLSASVRPSIKPSPPPAEPEPPLRTWLKPAVFVGAGVLLPAAAVLVIKFAF